MKKVLILSCNTGQGHNSCAQAIQEYWRERGAACDVWDALAFVSKRVSSFISNWHRRIYIYLPGLFRWGYRFSERHPALFQNRSKAHRLLTRGTDRLYREIAGGGYDTVICAHVFAGIMLTEMLREHPMALRTAFLATDYTCSPSAEVSDLDYYFIPHESLRRQFEEKGVPAERIRAVGLPVRAEIRRITDKRDAKRLVSIDPDRRSLLVMCGSMGCGPLWKIVRRLARVMPDDMEATVICGTNRRLRRRLERKCAGLPRLHIVGYTNQVSLYMDAADLYLTKPGGISVTEAAAKALPMALIDAVAGCELYNMRFFLDLGAAVTAPDARSLADRCVELVRAEDELARMSAVLERERFDRALPAIYDALS